MNGRYFFKLLEYVWSVNWVRSKWVFFQINHFMRKNGTFLKFSLDADFFCDCKYLRFSFSKYIAYLTNCLSAKFYGWSMFGSKDIGSIRFYGHVFFGRSSFDELKNRKIKIITFVKRKIIILPKHFDSRCNKLYWIKTIVQT